MYNVQTILAHNKQTHCQPPFPKTWTIKKIHQQTDIEKTISPSKFGLRN